MSGRASRRKGSQFERDIVNWLRENGYPHAERAYGAGRPDDVGDIDGIPGIVLEAKNCNRLELSGWLTEAETERAQARADYGIVVAKRRGKPVGDAYAVLPLREMVELLKEAGR